LATRIPGRVRRARHRDRWALYQLERPPADQRCDTASGVFFWEFLIYLIEGMVFLITGLQARTLIATPSPI
jgi:hypothetical protein